MASEKKRVVVVGGGVAGSFIAKTLQDHADVYLIDQKEYFEITWATLRSMVEPSFAERSVINHTEYLPNAKLITDTAIDLTDDGVLTSKGSQVAYDYLVIATGHAADSFSSKSERLDYYQKEYEKIKASNSILIVGGGPSGVELAGEIAVDFPDKKLTLVHRGARLLEFVGAKAGKKALDWLVKKKVQVILGKSVNLDDTSDGVYKTSDGESISAECHFKCTGGSVASSWLQKTILKGSLDSHGNLMVDANLRVKGHQKIFAIGDITDIAELKQGYLAKQHAAVAAKNVKLLIGGGTETKMAVYKPASPLAFVSLGRKEAIAQISCISFAGRLPGIIKSGDLFVGKTRKDLGLTPDGAQASHSKNK